MELSTEREAESFKDSSASVLLKKLAAIYRQANPPPLKTMFELCQSINTIYEQESPTIRPPDNEGLPGGLIKLDPNLLTVIVPDLHARTDFFYSLMAYPLDGELTICELLAQEALQVVCLGDGFHAEGRARERWAKALLEFQGGYQKHKAMDEEMRESLGVMQMVMETKICYPANFHFLKGNHENIANENGGGNYPFRKYAYEGAMVLEYIRRFYGLEFLEEYYTFEKHLPLLAVGNNFLVSHAEPKRCFKTDEVINYRRQADVVYGLTWTDNGEADEGAVWCMLNHYLPKGVQQEAKYFAGHRTVADRFQTRAKGFFVQFHNPHRFQIVVCKPEMPIDLGQCFLDIDKKI